MNLYFFVEGEKTEKMVYSAWVPHVFAGLQKVGRVEDLQGSHFFVTSSMGYPFKKETLEAAVHDAARHDAHLFACFDAKDESQEKKYGEINKVIANLLHDLGRDISHSTIIHNRCMETWFLGNRHFTKQNPQNWRMRACQQHYPVSERDPEQMPVPGDFRGTHAECHLAYLKAMFAEHLQMSYSKSRPGAVLEESHLAELARRCRETGHLPSLNALLESWEGLGGKIPGTLSQALPGSQTPGPPFVTGW
ncbi:MAG: hypothetical protein HQL63_02950 [Magnetococcales bacterium]|nr:hypothetical protein [Magnetococcales bacterium]